MPPISNKKKEKISEQILAHLFEKSPDPQFTSKIAENIARDEEFIKKLLHDLEKKRFIVQVSKNQQGAQYLRRQRWRLSNSTFDIYKQHNSNYNNP